MARRNIEGSRLSYNEIGEGNVVLATSQLLTGAFTIAPDSALVLFLDTGGVARNVLLPPLKRGATYEIYNTSAGAFSLTVRNALDTITVGTVAQNRGTKFTCDGAVWRVLIGA